MIFTVKGASKLDWKNYLVISESSANSSEAGDKSSSNSPPFVDALTPATPGSGYNTPQPVIFDRNIPSEKSRDCITSVSLVNFRYSNFCILDKVDTEHIPEDQWADELSSATIISFASHMIPVNQLLHPEASCCIHYKDVDQSTYSILCDLHYHWQASVSTSCFQWKTKKSTIIKDIAKAYNKQRFSNHEKVWLFEEMNEYLHILADIS